MADDLVVKLRLKGDSSGLTAAVKLSKDQLKGLDSQFDKLAAAEQRAGEGASRVAGELKSMGLKLAGGIGLAQLARAFVETNREAQRLSASLKVATGDYAEAGKVTAQLAAFSNRLGLALDDSVNAFLRLKNLGLEPSQAAIESYGNTAAAMGKSLDQMIEAVADAATGEFERLKEFGIKARVEGDKVKFTFKGVTKEIKNDARSIQNYLLDLGNTEFAGALEAQSSKLDGAFARLGNAVNGLARRIGESGLNDALTAVVDTTARLVEVASGAPASLDTLAAKLERLQSQGLRGRNRTGSSAAAERLREEIQQALEALPGVEGVRAELRRMDDEIRQLSRAREALNRRIEAFTGDRALVRGSGRNRRQTDYGRLVGEQQRVNAQLTELVKARDGLFDRLAEKEFSAAPFDDMAKGVDGATEATKKLNDAQKTLKDFLKDASKAFDDLKPLADQNQNLSETEKKLKEINASLDARDLVGKANRALADRRAGDARDFAQQAREIIEQLQQEGSNRADDLIDDLKRINDESIKIIQEMVPPELGISFDTESTQQQIEAMIADLNKAFGNTRAEVTVGIKKDDAATQAVAEIQKVVDGHPVSLPVKVDGDRVKAQISSLNDSVAATLKSITLADVRFDEQKSKANAMALKQSLESSLAARPIKVPVELEVTAKNRTGGQITDDLLAAAMRGGSL